MEAELRRQVQIRRRFMLLGQTLDGMRVWDIRQAVRALREAYGEGISIQLRGKGDGAVNALLAGLFEPAVAAVEVVDMPESLRKGPDYLNLLKFGDVPWLRRMARARGLVVKETR